MTLRRWWAVLWLPAAGCLRMETSLTLRPDGSGTIEVVATIPEATLTQLRAVARVEDELRKASGEPPPPISASRRLVDLFLFGRDDALHRELKAWADHGITVTQLKLEHREGRRNIHCALSFASVERLAALELFQEEGFSLTRNSTGDCVLYRPPSVVDRSRVEELMQADVLKQVAPLLSGFLVQIRVTTPSRVVRTNAPRRGSRSVEWTFNFDDHPESFVALHTEPLAVVFEGAGLTLPEVHLTSRASRTEPPAVLSPRAPTP